MTTIALDNRYAKVKYGQTLYGASALVQSLAWGIEVDWDGDGYFDGSNEADRLVDIVVNRGRTNFLKPRGQGFEPLKSGTAKITLANYDGRYDGWNTSSPLYPNVTYGREIRIRVRNMETGTVYNVFRGTISDIEPQGYGTDSTVLITAEDAWRFLREYRSRVAIQTNVSPDEAIGLVLDSINWPSRWGRNLDASSDNIPYWWASGSRIAATEIEEATNSFLGFFYVAADGKARFVARQNVPASVLNLYQDVLLKEMTNPQPWTNSRNVVRIRTHPRQVASTATIWQFRGTNPSIPAGESLVIWANYSYNNASCPAMNVITPAATTDWLANTAQDGSGTDKTANVSVAFTDFGDAGKITFTNNDAGLVYIIAPKVRGDAVYEADTMDVTYPADPSSVSQPRELFLDVPWQQDLNIAKDFVNAIGPFISDLHPFPAIQLEARYDSQFVPDLFDTMTLSIPKLGINGVAFRFGGIRHESVLSPQSVLTTFYLEPYLSASSFWIWDTASAFEVSTIFSW